jgi:hypothetical protein
VERMTEDKLDKIFDKLLPNEYSEQKGKMIDETLAEIRNEYAICIKSIEERGLGFVSTGLCIHAINIYIRKVREQMKEEGIELCIKKSDTNE